jgi:hypothetical protein
MTEWGDGMAHQEREFDTGLQRLLVTHLTTTVTCPECLSHYRHEDVMVIGHERSLWILAAVCSVCHTQGVVFVVVKDEVPADPLVELTPEEAAKFYQMPAISMDEVLDICLALDELADDFSPPWDREDE